jgi:hypothetical protein
MALPTPILYILFFFQNKRNHTLQFMQFQYLPTDSSREDIFKMLQTAHPCTHSCSGGTKEKSDYRHGGLPRVVNIQHG